MAAIVNDRDVLLQAATPRVVPVNLSSNVSVDPSQVNGLPTYLSNAKAVVLNYPSQVFQIAKTGTVTPTSLDFTATLKNITGNPTWTLSSGSGTITTYGNNPLKATIQQSNMTTDTVTLRASVTVSTTDSQGVTTSTTYYDEVTIVKLREGIDSVNSFLTNEAHTLQADSTGAVASYAGATSQMKVYIGTNDDTNNWNYTASMSAGVTASVSATGLCTVTNMSATSGYVDITANKSGYTSVTKRFSLTKSIAGANGTNGTNGTNGSNGQRGTVQVQLAISGSTWSDSSAYTAISNNGYGSPVNRDMVTLYNTGAQYSETRFYNNGSWLTISAYVNGNMIVSGTFAADNITAGTFTGLTFQTAASGARVVIYGPNYSDINKRNKLEVLDASGNTIGYIGGSSAGIYANGPSGLMPAIYGYHQYSREGVYGYSASGDGVGGLAGGSGNGIKASSQTGYGGYFRTNLGSYSAYFEQKFYCAAGADFNGALTGITSITATGNIGTNGNFVTSGVARIGYDAGVIDAAISGNGPSGQHGIRGRQSSGTAGLIAGTNGFDFYADGNGTNYGPFTGAHDAVVENGHDLEPGDIVIDVEPVGRRGWSNGITRIAKSGKAYQKAVIGVFVLDAGQLGDQQPAAFVEGQWTQTDEEGNVTLHMPVMSGWYYDNADKFRIIAVNALGEGAMNVCGQGGDIEAGDILVTSDMPGKAMKADPDMPMTFGNLACIVGKARESVTFSSPDEVKQVLVTYHCG